MYYLLLLVIVQTPTRRIAFGPGAALSAVHDIPCIYDPGSRFAEPAPTPQAESVHFLHMRAPKPSSVTRIVPKMSDPCDSKFTNFFGTIHT